MRNLSFKRTLFLIAYTVTLLVICFNLDVVLNMFSTILGVLSPFFIAIAIAFIINIPMRKIEPGISKKLSQKMRRLIAILLSVLLIVLIFSTILFFLVPQLIDSVRNLSTQITSYLDRFETFSKEIAVKFNIPDNIWDFIVLEFNGLIETASSYVISYAPVLFRMTLGFANSTINFFLGLVLSFYILSSKEVLVNGLKRILRAIFSDKIFKYLEHVMDITNKTFTSFISGQLLEACILGSLCTVGMLILRLDYAVLIGVIVGISSLIPIFGTILGTIPCIFILLVINPKQALVFLIFIFILQQLEGDFIYPRVVGKSIGISGLWVMLAMIVGGSLMGALGLVIGIPIFAIISILTQEWVNKRLDYKDSLNK